MKLGSRCFQPGEGPSRGLLRDCTTSPMDRFTAIILAVSDHSRHPSLETRLYLDTTAGVTLSLHWSHRHYPYRGGHKHKQLDI